MPCRWRTLATVWSEALCLRLASGHPTLPQVDPSNLCATSLRKPVQNGIGLCRHRHFGPCLVSQPVGDFCQAKLSKTFATGIGQLTRGWALETRTRAHSARALAHHMAEGILSNESAPLGTQKAIPRDQASPRNPLRFLSLASHRSVFGTTIISQAALTLPVKK